MGLQTSFHAPSGGTDFLGLRHSRLGATEIVYDNGSDRRMVWRVSEVCSDEAISDVLAVAVSSPRVIPTLYEELKKRSIRFEAV